jgi:hypothetical protein
MVAAFLRNYHEVLRNDLEKVLTPLAESGDRDGFRAAWNEYSNGIEVHAAMEDGVEGAGKGLTRMLESLLGADVESAQFKIEHEHDTDQREAVVAAIDKPATVLSMAFTSYKRSVIEHFVHEESVWQPLVPKLPNPKGPLFAEWVFSAGIAQSGFDDFLVHGVKSLSRYGSSGNTPEVATRVFVHAIHSGCTPDQWARLLPLVKGAMPALVWRAVVAEVPSLLNPKTEA